MRDAKGQGRTDTQYTAKPAPGIQHFLLRGFKLVKNSLATLVEALSNLIEIHASCGPLDQRRAKTKLQILQPAADRRYGYP